MDIEYDFRLDSKSGDPDKDSSKLYRIHSFLWNQTIPNKGVLDLSVSAKHYAQKILITNLTDNLSSDRMCPHFVGIYNNRFDDWLSDLEKERFQRKVRSIGGHIVFPAHTKNGHTINQARGVNAKIRDRFDLTLECIRRFFENQKSSPLSNTLERYSDFFLLFKNFETYISFFLLQDFVQDGKVIFSLPFDDFERTAFPQDATEYKSYMNNVVKKIDSRNKRIRQRLKMSNQSFIQLISN